MQPRQQPPACNTRLSVVARNALKPILGEDQVSEIERQVEAGKLSLADLILLPRDDASSRPADRSADGWPMFTPDSPRMLLRAGTR